MAWKPISLDDRLRFLEANYVLADGRRFDPGYYPPLKDEVFRPFNGFRLRARDPLRLCADCESKAGTIIESWDWTVVDALAEHASDASDECGGLTLVPIIMTVVSIRRQLGKTVALASLILSTMLSEPRRAMAFLASQEDKGNELIEEKLVKPIESSKPLARAFDIVGGKITCKSTGSTLRILNRAFRSAVGGSQAYLFVDEACHVDPRTFMGLLPSMLAQGGAYCIGHPENQYVTTKTCPIEVRGTPCGLRVTPWFPRVVVVSSLDVIDGSSSDWFVELIDWLKSTTDAPEYHLFTSDAYAGALPPSQKSEVREALEKLGNVPALRTFVEVQLHNRARRLGDDFITETELKRCTDQHLGNLEGSERPCVSFLDGSLSVDLTSWVVAEDATEIADEEGNAIPGAEPWDVIRIVRIDTWDPKDPRQCPRRHIDIDAVQMHWDRFIPRFPNARVHLVDTRGFTEWKDFALYNLRDRPVWGKRVHMMHRKTERGKKAGQIYQDVTGGTDDRDTAWHALEHRLAYGKIILPGGALGARIKKELLGVQRVERQDGTYTVKDRNRKKQHADIADAIAGCCLLAYRESTRKAPRGFKELYGGGGLGGPPPFTSGLSGSNLF